MEETKANIIDGNETNETHQTLENVVNTKFNNNIKESINTILKNIDNNDNDDNDEDYTKLLISHRIDKDMYHEMRRAFRNSDNYYVYPLSKETVEEMFKKLENHYNPNDGKNPYKDNLIQKYLMISFDSENKKKANFNIQAVWGHSFGSYFSCYSEKFLMKLFDLYAKVSLVKSNDELNGREIGGRKYNGNFCMVCVQCKEPIDTRNIPENFTNIEFFDVAHDPDKPGTEQS